MVVEAQYRYHINLHRSDLKREPDSFYEEKHSIEATWLAWY